jgi:hypothetical protein
VRSSILTIEDYYSHLFQVHSSETQFMKWNEFSFNIAEYSRIAGKQQTCTCPDFIQVTSFIVSSQSFIVSFRVFMACIAL